MNRRVILWRHGRTEWNVAGRVQGQSDIPLDEVGVAQAKVAGARLASLKPDRILSSDLQRAAATAAELGAACGVQPELDSRFRELNFGAREGLTWAEAWAEFPTEMQAWVDGHEQAMPGAETYEQAGARFDQALRSELPTLASGQTLVIVAHGAILRTGMNTWGSRARRGTSLADYRTAIGLFWKSGPTKTRPFGAWWSGTRARCQPQFCPMMTRLLRRSNGEVSLARPGSALFGGGR